MIIIVERVRFLLPREAAVSIQTYYRRVLVLPVLMPALASALLLLGELPPGLGVVVFVLYWSLLLGGVPYLLFAGGFMLWARGRTDRQVRTGILLAPLVYAPLLMACFVAFLAVDGTFGNGGVEGTLELGGFAVLFGYGYVVLAELGRVLLRLGLPTPAPEPQPAA
jgi:hypothetical protein